MVSGEAREGDERRLATAGIGSRCNLRHLRRPVTRKLFHATNSTTGHPSSLLVHLLLMNCGLRTVSNDITNLGSA
jgi:hypothetical protein